MTDFPRYAANRFQLGATLNQVLFDLAKFQTLAQSGHLEAAARGTAAEQMLASEFEAVRRFYALWTAQKQLLVLQATADRSKEFADRAQALFEAGRGTKGDALAAAVNLGTDRINVEKQRAVVSQAQIDLASWLSRPEGQELDAVDPPLPDDPASAVGQPRAGAGSRPHQPPGAGAVRRPGEGGQVLRDRRRPRAGRPGSTSSCSGSARAPRPTRSSRNFGTQSAVSGAITLNWDLFSGFQTDALDQAGARPARPGQAEPGAERAGRGGPGQGGAGLARCAARALAVAQQNRVTATQNLDYAQERFKAGASSTLEVRDAQLKLAQAYQTLIQTRSDAEVARAGLDKAMGTLGNGATP